MKKQREARENPKQESKLFKTSEETQLKSIEEYMSIKITTFKFKIIPESTERQVQLLKISEKTKIQCSMKFMTTRSSIQIIEDGQLHSWF